MHRINDAPALRTSLQSLRCISGLCPRKQRLSTRSSLRMEAAATRGLPRRDRVREEEGAPFDAKPSVMNCPCAESAACASCQAGRMTGHSVPIFGPGIQRAPCLCLPAALFGSEPDSAAKHYAPAGPPTGQGGVAQGRPAPAWSPSRPCRRNTTFS